MLALAYITINLLKSKTCKGYQSINHFFIFINDRKTITNKNEKKSYILKYDYYYYYLIYSDLMNLFNLMVKW